MDGSAPGRADARPAARRGVEAILHPALDDRERAAVAGPVTGLVAAGLALALFSPLAVFAGFDALAIAVLAALAFACLGAAAALAAFGRSDGALALLAGLAALPLAALAVELDSVWPMAPVAIALGESALARRRLLFRLLLPVAFAATALLGFLSMQGLGPGGAALAGWELALPCFTAYGAAAAMRALRPRREAVAAAAAPMPAGREAAEMLGRVHVQDRVRFLEAVDRVRETGTEARATLRLADGEGRFHRAELLLERGERGVDVRGGGEAEAPAEELRAALLATVSHELRTPLNAIIGFADILDDELFGPFGDPRQKEYIGLIRRSGHHLLTVVNGLLDVSRIEAGRYRLQVEPFALREATQAACEMLHAEAQRKGLRLVAPAAADIRLVADPQGCRQILVNLLSNAVKFTDQGTVCLSTRVEGGFAVIEVADTGIGIAACDIARLGRPFEQASQGSSRRYEGTGLGLSLVKGLAELHGGSMEIRSQPGRGTTVAVRIPLDCAAHAGADQTPSPNVVTLTDARKKTSSPAPQDHPDRRTA